MIHIYFILLLLTVSTYLCKLGCCWSYNSSKVFLTGCWFKNEFCWLSTTGAWSPGTGEFPLMTLENVEKTVDATLGNWANEAPIPALNDWWSTISFSSCKFNWAGVSISSNGL